MSWNDGYERKKFERKQVGQANVKQRPPSVTYIIEGGTLYFNYIQL